MSRKFLIGSILVMGATAAGAQSLGTASLGVTGTIRPSTCSVTLGNGGIADYGIMGSATVKAWSVAADPIRYYDAAFKPVPMMINCPAPTKFALSFVDNRAGTVDTTVNIHYFGLGTHTIAGGTTKNIGLYYINHQNLKVRNSLSAALNSPGKLFVTTGVASPSSTFRPATGVETVGIIPADSLAFSATGAASAPEALVEVSGDLLFNIQPLKDTVDNATTDIVLSGSATLTLVGI